MPSRNTTTEQAETTSVDGARRSAIAKRDAGHDLTPREVDAIYAVRTQKVLAWIADGSLEADDMAAGLSKRPRWRIRAAALATFFATRRETRKSTKQTHAWLAPKEESLIDPATGKIRVDARRVGAFAGKGVA